MNLSENLNASFEYAKKFLGDAGRLIILIVLDLIPIVNWIVAGYAARVLRETPGMEVPPKLEKYGELFVDGAKIFFASLIYMIIPLAVIFAGVGSFIASMVPFEFGRVAPRIVFGGTGLVLVLVGVILAIFFLILLGIGIAHMIKTGSFGKAFAFGEILGIIRGVGWGKYLGWIILVVVIAVIVGAVSAAIPFVGAVISAIIAPIFGVFLFRSLGLLYNEGAPAGMRQAMPTATAAAALVCSSCGTPLEPHHKFCPKCGAPTSTPPPPPLEGIKFCVSCGTKIPASAKFCGTCGAKQA